MLRPRLGRPFAVTLPSGATTTITAIAHEPLPLDLPAALRTGAVTSTLQLLEAPLADANFVEAIAAVLGAIASPVARLRCRNCHAEIELDGAPFLPLAPLLSPQGDPELDPPADRDSEHPLPGPFALGRKGRVRSFRLARRTLQDRVRLVTALGPAAFDPDLPLPLTASVVEALGLSFVTENGDPIESPTAIARALKRLDDIAFDAAWCAIARAWDEQHYSPRLLAPVPCPRCGARHDVEVPARRPIAVFTPVREEHRHAEEGARAFPDLETFRGRAQAMAREIIEAAGLSEEAGLEVVVDDDVPPCDDGGEPLMGSYTPEPNGGGDAPRPTTSPFIIALYYRTFRAMFDDEPYDVDAEIRETLEHELDHHLGHLAGDDPLDDAERDEIERERARLLGTRTPAASLVDGAGWLATDLARFFRTTWPMWLLALVALLVILASAR